MNYPIPDQGPLIGPYAISKKLRNSFVIAIRDAFSTDTAYPYVVDPATLTTDLDKSAIEIVDIASFSTVKMPCIVVTSVMDRGSTFFFSDDLFSENWENGTVKSETHGSILTMGVSFTIRTYDSLSRDELCDRIYIYLRTVRDKLAPLGIECRHVSVGAPTEETHGGREVFVGSINVNTVSEWTYTTEIGINEILSGISMDVGLTGITI